MIVFDNNGVLNKIMNVCQTFAEPQERYICLRTAAEIFVVSYSDIKGAQMLCSVLPKHQDDECGRYIMGVINRYGKRED